MAHTRYVHSTIFALVLGALPLAAGAMSYTYTVLPPHHGENVLYAFVVSINKAGDAAGNWLDQSGLSHGFIYTKDGKYKAIDYPGAYDTHVAAIGDHGEIVGSYCSLPSCYFYGFVYTHGQFTSYNAPGASETYLTAVNQSGTIAGNAEVGLLTPDLAFTLSPSGTYTAILSGNSSNSVTAAGINKRGEVVGDYNDFSYNYAKGVVSAGPFPANSLTTTAGVNALGQVVGTYVPPTGPVVDEGFVYQGSKLTTIVGPGATNTYVYGANDSGVIVGEYDSTGFTYLNGTFASVAPPNASATAVQAINDAGVLGGTFSPNGAKNGKLLGFVAVPSK